MTTVYASDFRVYHCSKDLECVTTRQLPAPGHYSLTVLPGSKCSSWFVPSSSWFVCSYTDSRYGYVTICMFNVDKTLILFQ